MEIHGHATGFQEPEVRGSISSPCYNPLQGVVWLPLNQLAFRGQQRCQQQGQKNILFGLQPQVCQKLVPQDNGKALDLAKPDCKTSKERARALSGKSRTAFILVHVRVQTYVKDSGFCIME